MHKAAQHCLDRHLGQHEHKHPDSHRRGRSHIAFHRINACNVNYRRLFISSVKLPTTPALSAFADATLAHLPIALSGQLIDLGGRTKRAPNCRVRGSMSTSQLPPWAVRQ